MIRMSHRFLLAMDCKAEAYEIHLLQLSHDSNLKQCFRVHYILSFSITLIKHRSVKTGKHLLFQLGF